MLGMPDDGRVVARIGDMGGGAVLNKCRRATLRQDSVG